MTPQKTPKDARTKSDIKSPPWLAHLPAPCHPYAILARLDRPIGTWLLVIPAWWGILLAAIAHKTPPAEVASIMLLFLIGAIAMRSAGCVINDLWDRKLDKAVTRTRNRPLAAETIKPQHAMLLLCGLMTISLAVLIHLPPPAIITAIASLPLVILYPLAKRRFPLPQAVLAITFAWSSLVGWTSISPYPTTPALILYTATALWVFGYDTIYAIQDAHDDKIANIKSAAITLQKYLPQAIASAYTAMLLMLFLLTQIIPLGWITIIGLAALAMHLAAQIRQVKQITPPNPQKAAQKKAGDIFTSNRDAGLIMLAALTAEYAISLGS